MKARTKLWLLTVLVLSAACSTPARLSYLRDLEYNVPTLAPPAPELRLKCGDRISIQVEMTLYFASCFKSLEK